MKRHEDNDDTAPDEERVPPLVSAGEEVRVLLLGGGRVLICVHDGRGLTCLHVHWCVWVCISVLTLRIGVYGCARRVSDVKCLACRWRVGGMCVCG